MKKNIVGNRKILVCVCWFTPIRLCLSKRILTTFNQKVFNKRVFNTSNQGSRFELWGNETKIMKYIFHVRCWKKKPWVSQKLYESTLKLLFMSCYLLEIVCQPWQFDTNQDLRLCNVRNFQFFIEASNLFIPSKSIRSRSLMLILLIKVAASIPIFHMKVLQRLIPNKKRAIFR